MSSFFGLIIVFISLIFHFFSVPADGFYKIIQKPKKVDAKGIYITGYTAGSKERRQELIQLIERTELNAIVIDVKDSTGRVFFDTNIPLVNEIQSEQVRIPDIRQLMRGLKSKEIYTIARLAIFQDPYLAEKRPDLALKTKNGLLWRDWKGLAWVDPTSKEVWEYNLNIIHEAIDLGFDEINLDYIRFPSDGNLEEIIYPFYDEKKSKVDSMKEFFEYIDRELTFSPIITSVDLFGMVLVRDDGLGIGQRFQDASSHFDYIAPMVYPSHYPDGFESFANPAEYPYEIVRLSLDKAGKEIQGKRAKFRPWLQDFDLGAIYTPQMIRQQIQATYDTGWDGWTLWNASNQYSEKALLPAE